MQGHLKSTWLNPQQRQELNIHLISQRLCVHRTITGNFDGFIQTRTVLTPLDNNTFDNHSSKK